MPFSTAYLGEHHFSRDATLLYLATMLFPAVAYTWLQSIIRRTGIDDAARAYHRQTTRKGIFATLIYMLGVPLAFVVPGSASPAPVLVAFFWFLPHGPLDGLFHWPAARKKLD